MMEDVIVDDGNRLTVYELVERVIPCIIAKHYSENYIQGFRSTFRNLLAYCNKNEKKYFTAELAQQFMLDCYGVQPGTVERRCSRVHRAMDLLSDYQHFNAVMLRRRLNREFPAGLQEGAVNYLQKLSLTDAGRIRCAATEMFFFALQIICSALESRITNHFQQIL